MSISIGGVPIALPTSEIVSAIERDISLDRLQLAFSRSWPGFGTVGLATPTIYRPWPPLPPKLNRYYHPSGASRWGSGLFLCSVDQINSIAPAAFGGDGLSSNEQLLVISSEDQSGTLVEQIMVNATVFPPIPLYQVLNDDEETSSYGMYILYLTDLRYYWHQIPCPDFSISESGDVSWQDVIDDIAESINYELDEIIVSDIPMAYLQPSRALNLTNEPIAIVMDAVAANLGMRWTLSLDAQETLYLQNFSDALDAFNADDQQTFRTMRAGGPKFTGTF